MNTYGTISTTRLGKLEVEWESLSSSLRRPLLAALTQSMSQMSAKGFATCLYGIALVCPNSVDSAGDEAGGGIYEENSLIEDNDVWTKWMDEVTRCILKKVGQMDTWDLTNLLFA